MASMRAFEWVEVLPDVFDRVQFRRSRWQQDDGEVLGNLEIACRVPSGAVHEQDGMGLADDIFAAIKYAKGVGGRRSTDADLLTLRERS